MSAYKVILKILIFTMLAFTSACKKDAGPGGKNSINGTIVYKNGATGGNSAAAGATVYIYYGTHSAKTEFDQAILTDANGKYQFNTLHKGKYFIKAEYRDANGFNYSTAGYAIELKNKKNTLEVNITLE